MKYALILSGLAVVTLVGWAALTLFARSHPAVNTSPQFPTLDQVDDENRQQEAAGKDVTAKEAAKEATQDADPDGKAEPADEPRSATATFGSGCFWCTEAVFENLKGVRDVVSGYSGGRIKNPTYEQVCSGLTRHAEVTQITFDPGTVSYAQLLEVFWRTHDPTTPNRQGNDFGPQYRSVIFYHDQQQRRLAERYKERLDETGAFNAPIVTEITAFKDFYPAEAYHQDYYRLNPGKGYCQFIIRPKLEKFKKAFHEKLK